MLYEQKRDENISKLRPADSFSIILWLAHGFEFDIYYVNQCFSTDVTCVFPGIRLRVFLAILPVFLKRFLEQKIKGTS